MQHKAAASICLSAMPSTMHRRAYLVSLLWFTLPFAAPFPSRKEVSDSEQAIEPVDVGIRASRSAAAERTPLNCSPPWMASLWRLESKEAGTGGTTSKVAACNLAPMARRAARSLPVRLPEFLLRCVPPTNRARWLQLGDERGIGEGSAEGCANGEQKPSTGVEGEMIGSPRIS